MEENFQEVSRSLLAHYILEDFGRLIGSLLENLLKYNVLEDFQEVFHKTSEKSRLSKSLLAHYILEDFREDFL